MNGSEFDYTGFMEQLGMKTEPEKPAEPPATEPPKDGEVVTEPAGEVEQPAGEPAGEPPTGAEPEPETKPAEQLKPEINASAKAFAEMRIQNKKYKDVIEGLAKLTGVQADSPENLIEKVNEILLGAQAKKDNVPLELVKEVQSLRSLQTDLVKQQREQTAILGLRKLSETYSLDNNAITKFVEELIEKGQNPLENEIDVVEAYKALHFDDIVKMQVEKALAENKARLEKAQAQGSTPQTQIGGGTQEPTKITDIKSLDALLATRK